MILFLGDSFTWGQGLEWELMLSEGIHTSHINTLIPPMGFNEKLPYKYQLFREENRFPTLISKHFNVQNHVARFGNGGNNYDNKFILNKLPVFLEPECINLIIFQFTHPHRPGHTMTDDEYLKMKTDINVIENDVLGVIDIVNKDLFRDTKFLFLSWIPEVGEIFDSINMSHLFTKIKYNEKVSNGFEFLLEDSEIRDVTCLGYKYPELKDHHISIEGHQTIANSIIEKIKTLNIY